MVITGAGTIVIGAGTIVIGVGTIVIGVGTIAIGVGATVTGAGDGITGIAIIGVTGKLALLTAKITFGEMREAASARRSLSLLLREWQLRRPDADRPE
jgi:hypothetical protein